MKLAADTIASPTVKPGLAPEVLDPGGVTAAARGRSRRRELNVRGRRR